MKNQYKIIIAILLFCSLSIKAQTPVENLLVNLHEADTATMNGLTPEIGALVYNTDDNMVYTYTGSIWKSLEKTTEIEDNGDGTITFTDETGTTTTIGKTYIVAGNNVTLTGTGTQADPIVINTTVSTFTDNGDGTYTFSNGVDPDVTLSSSQGGIPTPIVSSSDANGGCNEALQINETRDVVITGENFEGSSTVIIPGQTVNSVTINSSTQITANVTAVGTPGNYDVEVTNSSGSGTLPNGFEIKPALVTYNFAAGDMTLTTQMSYDGSILRRTAGNGWNRSGHSTVYEIPANSEGYVEFSADQTNRQAMLGLSSNPSQDASFTSMDYSIYFRNNGSIRIYEGSSYRGDFGSYTTSDVFSVNRDCDGVVTYLKNGTVFYTSTVNSTQKLSFDSSFYNNAFQASNISITY